MTSTSFAPAGITDDPEIRTATSLIDYIFRRLAKNYLSFDDQLELGLASIDDMPEQQTSLVEPEPMAKAEPEAPQQNLFEEVKSAPTVVDVPKAESKSSTKDDQAPMCYSCGNQTQRSGSCYVCTSCGSTTGCS